MRFKLLLVFSVLLLFMTVARADVPSIGETKCVGNCGSSSRPSQPQVPSQSTYQPSYTPKDEESQKQIELEKIRLKKEAEEKHRQAEFLKKKQDTLELMNGSKSDDFNLKGSDVGNDFSFEEPSDTDLNKNKSTAGSKGAAKTDKQQSKPKQNGPGWQKALGCAMNEVYTRAESLGPDGIRFAQDLRNEMTRVLNEAGQPVKDKNDVNVVSLDLNREISAGKDSNGQFIVDVIVNTHGDGNIHVIVDSYFSKSAGKKDKHKEVQSILVLDKYGKVIESEKSKKVKACLAH